MAQDSTEGAAAAILATVRRFWGFEGLRPLQAEAIRAGLERRDSLVVMPTGGGKSLCYQVPPAVANRTDVVVSPLIALMKDQVDALRACGFDTQKLAAVGMTRHRVDFHGLARQGAGNKDRLVGAVDHAVAAMADPVDHQMLNHAPPR